MLLAVSIFLIFQPSNNESNYKETDTLDEKTEVKDDYELSEKDAIEEVNRSSEASKKASQAAIDSATKLLEEAFGN